MRRAFSSAYTPLTTFFRPLLPHFFLLFFAVTDAAMTECEEESGNNVFTCYPNDTTVVAQHEWTTVVCALPRLSLCSSSFHDASAILITGNSNLPQWAQTELVNLYVFHADSGDQVLNMTNVTNPSGTAGEIHVQVDDRWFGSRGLAWDGSNISFPFYWLITRNDRPIENTDIPQSTFTAVRT